MGQHITPQIAPGKVIHVDENRYNELKRRLSIPEPPVGPYTMPGPRSSSTDGRDTVCDENPPTHRI